jgi:hypothetical protein
MHDESPTPPTTDEPPLDAAPGPIDGPAAESSDPSTSDPSDPSDPPTGDPRGRPVNDPTDRRRDRDGGPPATGSAPPRPRDGMDPPEGAATPPPSGPSARPSDDDGSAGEGHDPNDNSGDEDPDDEPLAYRLERLRLWRALATLAVVVARLIRSL